MPLVPCPNCGNQISSSASNCPKCGVKINQTSNVQQLSAPIQISQQIQTQQPMGWKVISIIFFVISFIDGFVGYTESRNDPSVVGGDAYNYIIGAGRGTAIVCFAIILALAGVACAIFDLTAKISYYNKHKH